MSKLIYLGMAVCFVVGLWVIVLTAMPKHGVVVYNCSIAEISPDYPIEVKEKCRKLSVQSGRI
jgi:hypothetical protein